mgnify:CR=1 FL=1
MKHLCIKKLFLAAVFTFFTGALSVSTAVAADLAAPQVAIEKASEILKQNLQDKNFTQDFAKINEFVEDVIDPHMDFNKIASLVVGKYWRRATVDEKKNFIQEFKTLLVRTYSRAFIDFDDWSMRFLPLNMETAVKKVKNTQAVIVKTEILQPGKRPFSINYRMWMVDGKWKVYDIMIEGISLVKNYRKSIGARVKKAGSNLASVTEYLAKKNSAALAKKTDEKGNQESQS